MKTANVQINPALVSRTYANAYQPRSILNSTNPPLVTSLRLDGVRDIFDVTRCVASYVRGFLPLNPDSGTADGKVDYYSQRGDNSFGGDDTHFYLQVLGRGIQETLRVDIKYIDGDSATLEA